MAAAIASVVLPGRLSLRQSPCQSLLRGHLGRGVRAKRHGFIVKCGNVSDGAEPSYRYREAGCGLV